jgi:hypothetical protein
MTDFAVNNSKKQRGRPFPSGVSGNARGRPKGARNKRTQVTIEGAKAGGELPLDYMLRIMRDPKASNTRRDEMARTAAPYLHPKITAITYTPPQDEADEDNTINLVFIQSSRPPTPIKFHVGLKLT